MGSRQGASISSVLGHGGAKTSAQRELGEKLENSSTMAVAEATVAVIAHVVPAVAVLYAAYKVAEFMYPIVKEGVEEFDRTHNTDMAIEKMKQETVKQTGKQIIETGVEILVGNSIDVVKETAKIVIDQNADTFIKTAATETINGVIE